MLGLSKAWRPKSMKIWLASTLVGSISFPCFRNLASCTSPCVEQAQRQVAFEQARLLLSPGSHAVVQPLKPSGRFLQMIIQILGCQ